MFKFLKNEYSYISATTRQKALIFWLLVPLRICLHSISSGPWGVAGCQNLGLQVTYISQSSTFALYLDYLADVFGIMDMCDAETDCPN